MKLTNEVEARSVSWDITRRQAQSQRTKTLKPWLVSTGPKTAKGKKRSSRNALKHGQRSARTIRFKRVLREAKKYLAFVKSLNRMERERRRIALGLTPSGHSHRLSNASSVIPAKAGIPLSSYPNPREIPAFAGMAERCFVLSKC